MLTTEITNSPASQGGGDVLRSVKFTAEALDLHPMTVYEMAWAGRIKSVKVGNARKIPASEINRIVKEGIRANDDAAEVISAVTA